MLTRAAKNRHKGKTQDLAVLAISLLVGAYGLYVIGDTLFVQLFAHRIRRLSSFQIDIPILFGLSIIYLSLLLKRRKKTAWTVTICAYIFYMVLGLSQILSRINFGRIRLEILIRDFIGPIIIIGLLYTYREHFVVKSDIQGFRFAIRFALIMLTVTIIYGVAGFELLDTSDFHQEIGFQSALHYTIDQFNITTTKPVHPYTRRAHLFTDSLSFISSIAFIYALFSLFQPFRARYADQTLARERVQDLLDHYGAPSEEFFKLWPHDKQYFFDETKESAIAFYVHRGVALILSDPVGNQTRYPALLDSFIDLCFNNDWLPALVHVSDSYKNLYEKHGFTMQKLGQEAIVNIKHFESELKDSKYFRHILNRFNKQSYTYELLDPPHHQAIVDRLRVISDDWLSKGSRSERGYVMGYFTEEYVQMCEVVVARDAAGTIQAFSNLVPANFDHEEATYDMLRQSSQGLSNINDYLLINLMNELHKKDYKRLNMGLSPLAGLDEAEEEDNKSLVDNVLQFAYANGDKFYSFSGLYKFKAKYDPEWEARYIGYKGGVANFSRTMTALTRAMTKVVKQNNR